jgi:hypothetical protein
MTLAVRILVLSAVTVASVGAINIHSQPYESARWYEQGRLSYRQVQTVLDEKESRTAAQKKIDSQLLYALKQKRGETKGVPTEPIKLELDEKGRALVDVTAKVSTQVTNHIRKLGGIVVSEEPQYHAIRAMLALEKLESLAGRKDVSFIAPAAQSMNNRGNNRVPKQF